MSNYDGKMIAQKLRADLKEEIKKLEKYNKVPGLAVVQMAMLLQLCIC